MKELTCSISQEYHTAINTTQNPTQSMDDWSTIATELASTSAPRRQAASVASNRISQMQEEEEQRRMQKKMRHNLKIEQRKQDRKFKKMLERYTNKMREYDERRKARSLQLAKSPMKLRRKQTAEQRMMNVTAIQKPKRVRAA
eukprot:1133782-Rhodomonas_salina.1